MKNIDINATIGILSVNGTTIAPLAMSDLVATLDAQKEKYINITPTNGWATFGIDVTLAAYKFGLNISYNGNNIHSCWLAWDGGNLKEKGYECTENELISDKKNLTKFLTKYLEKEPDEKNYTCDLFLFEWGYISTSASLQSALATIGFSWKTPHPLLKHEP